MIIETYLDIRCLLPYLRHLTDKEQHLFVREILSNEATYTDPIYDRVSYHIRTQYSKVSPVPYCNVFVMDIQFPFLKLSTWRFS